MAKLDEEITAFNAAQEAGEAKICKVLAREIHKGLPGAENKIWHRCPVWFIEGNPIAGYGKLKGCVRLLFWSGQSFKTKGLAKEGTFKAAEKRFVAGDEVDLPLLAAWLAEARVVQWDYKNLIKRRGKLVRLKIARD